MIRIERQTVGRRIFFRYPEILHAELVLHEIQETQTSVFGLLECAVPLDRGHLYGISIEVISFQRPVYHVFAVREFSVGNHILRTPHPVFFLRMLADRIRAAAGKFGHIIAVRLRHRHRVVVFLEYHHIRQILYDAVCKFRRHVFVSYVSGLHTYVIRDTDGCSHVSELGPVYQYPANNFILPAVAGQCHFPTVTVMFERLRLSAEADFEIFFPSGNIPEYPRTDRRFEHHMADPARLQGFRSAVMRFEAVPEFVPDSASEFVTSVSSADSGRGEHTAEPFMFLHKKDISSASGSLDSRGSAGSACTYNHNIILPVAASGSDARDTYRQ